MTSNADIRAWARTEGLDVPARGPLPESLRDRYGAAHPDVSEAAPPPGTGEPERDEMAELQAMADYLNEDMPGTAHVVPGPADVAERKPRTIAGPTTRQRLAQLRKPKGKPGRKAKARPRIPVDSLISRVWEGLAAFARPLPATSRLLRIQAPVAGVILEDTVKGTIVDKALQPLAQLEQTGKAAFALAGPPIFVAMMELQPESAPFVMPVLRESLLVWCEVGGPRMDAAMERARTFESTHGRSVDEMIAVIFASVSEPGSDDAAAAAEAEEELIRRAQRVTQDSAPV